MIQRSESTCTIFTPIQVMFEYFLLVRGSQLYSPSVWPEKLVIGDLDDFYLYLFGKVQLVGISVP